MSGRSRIPPLGWVVIGVAATAAAATASTSCSRHRSHAGASSCRSSGRWSRASSSSAWSWASVAALGPPFDLTPPLERLGPATVSVGLLAIAFGAIALAIGCATGRRGAAIGVTAGIAAGTYLLDVLAPSLEPIAWAERLSPFYYYGDHQPLVNGLDPVHALVLVLIGALALGYALVAFERRDLAS